jgi:hypothetical protein
MLHVGPRRARPDELLSVTDYLDELRRRLVICVLALVVAFAGMYAVHDGLIDLLARPLPDDLPRLTTLSPTEPVFTTLKVVFWAALLLALPSGSTRPTRSSSRPPGTSRGASCWRSRRRWPASSPPASPSATWWCCRSHSSS